VLTKEISCQYTYNFVLNTRIDVKFLLWSTHRVREISSRNPSFGGGGGGLKAESA
jgi:hypothetical protein